MIVYTQKFSSQGHNQPKIIENIETGHYTIIPNMNLSIFALISIVDSKPLKQEDFEIRPVVAWSIRSEIKEPFHERSIYCADVYLNVIPITSNVYSSSQDYNDDEQARIIFHGTIEECKTAMNAEIKANQKQ